MRLPSRKVPVFEPMRMAKGTRSPCALDSNTIPFHASASNAPIWTSENSCATCAARDSGKSRARKIAGCSHRAPGRRTRCLYRRTPVPSCLIARVIARERLPVDLLASFICGSAHFEAVADSGSMELPRTTNQTIRGGLLGRNSLPDKWILQGECRRFEPDSTHHLIQSAMCAPPREIRLHSALSGTASSRSPKGNTCSPSYRTIPPRKHSWGLCEGAPVCNHNCRKSARTK